MAIKHVYGLKETARLHLPDHRASNCAARVYRPTMVVIKTQLPGRRAVYDRAAPKVGGSAEFPNGHGAQDGLCLSVRTLRGSKIEDVVARVPDLTGASAQARKSGNKDHRTEQATRSAESYTSHQ